MYSSGSLGKGVGLFRGKISGIEFVDFVLFSFWGGLGKLSFRKGVS